MNWVMQLPESVFDYMRSAGVRTAVDHLLDQKPDTLPLDLQWSEVQQYHDALLMACKVRRDYLESLMGAWDLVWGAVLKAWHIDERQAVPFTELEPDTLPTPEVVWDDALYRVFRLPGQEGVWLYTALGMDAHDGMIAYVAVEPGKKGVNFMEDCSAWLPDDNGYWRTKSQVAVLGAAGKIDLSELAAAAEEAIGRIVAAFPTG